MTIFQPNHFFIFSLIFSLIFLGKRIFGEKIKPIYLLNLGLLFLIQILAVFQNFLPGVLPNKHYFLIQIAFLGFCTGSILVREFFRRFPPEKEPKEMRHQRNVQKKLPLLISVVAITLQNTSGLEQWVTTFFCILLLASVFEVFKREGRGSLFNYMAVISAVMILQSLLSLMGSENAKPLEVINILGWSILIFFVDKLEVHYWTLKKNE